MSSVQYHDEAEYQVWVLEHINGGTRVMVGTVSDCWAYLYKVPGFISAVRYSSTVQPGRATL